MRKRQRIDIDYRKDAWWGIRDVRARLERMVVGEEFACLCLPVMRDQLVSATLGLGGEIVREDPRSYGVLLVVRKQKDQNDSVCFPMFMWESCFLVHPGNAYLRIRKEKSVSL